MKKNGNLMGQGPAEEAFGGGTARMVRERLPLELALLIWSGAPWEVETRLGGSVCYIRKLGGDPCVLIIFRMALWWKDGAPFGWGLFGYFPRPEPTDGLKGGSPGRFGNEGLLGLIKYKSLILIH